MKKNGEHSPKLVLFWMRNDLRVSDQPAFRRIHSWKGRCLPCFVLDDSEPALRLGEAARWYLHHSLADLDTALRELGGGLVLERGPTAETLLRLAKQYQCDAIVWPQGRNAVERQQDKRIAQACKREGYLFEICEANQLFDADAIVTASGTPYQVFTPFYRKVVESSVANPVSEVPVFFKAPASPCTLDELKLLPDLDWADGFHQYWQPGCRNSPAQKRRLTKIAPTYIDLRDLPSEEGTSRLSPALRFGTVSARSVWHTLKRQHEKESSKAKQASIAGLMRQLVWRDFTAYISIHFPEARTNGLRPEFQNFPWRENLEHLMRWQKGQTGFPIVDAAMRQLWNTGWMHNRLRMIVGSFLVKDLLLHWRHGEQWFEDTLVDAELSNNNFGWQWVAGCGADAAPYFRIFNPVSQSKKFDPEGKFIRLWVPELRKLPDTFLHEPWTASESDLAAAGIRLGDSYPDPIVDHGLQRKKALMYYHRLKNGNSSEQHGKV